MSDFSSPNPTPLAYCRICGKPLFDDVQRTESGAAYCAQHFPVAAGPAAEAGAPRYTQSAYAERPGASAQGAGASGFAESSAYADAPPSPRPAASPYTGGLGTVPALAFFLGFIPGVGAIYNGQYAKGLIHAVTFGLVVSILSSHVSYGVEPLLGILLAVFIFYMAFEAYHTARKRRDGEAVDEFSSLVQMSSLHIPLAGVGLIVLGLLLLLMTNGLVTPEMFRRAWPAGLILIGGYLLYMRVKGTSSL